LVEFTDSLAVTVSDSYTLTVKLAYTFSDSLSTTISDTYTLTIRISYSFSDGLSITITDTYTLTVKVVTQYSFSDSISITISDTYTLTVKAPTAYSFNDTLSITISDTYVIQLPQQFLSGWKYRKIINVNTQTPYNNGLSYYVIRFKLYYGSGTDNLSTFEIYLNGHARTDFGDVRFVSDPDTPYMTLLSYWFEERIDGDHVVVWVKIPVSGNYTWLGLYYGNQNATYVGDIYQVFIYADTQNDVNANKWYRVDSRATVLWYDSTTIEGQLPDDVWAESIGFPINVVFGGVEVKLKYWNRLYSNDSGDYFNIYGIATDGSEYGIVGVRHGTFFNEFVVTVEGSDVVNWGFPTDNGVHNVLLRIYANKVYIEADTGTGTWNTSRTYTKITKIHFGNWNWYGTSSVDVDYVMIRPYVDPEPTLNAVGGEEYLVVTYSFTDNINITLVDDYSLTIKSPLIFTDLININIVDNYIVSLGLIFTDLINIGIMDVYVLKTPYIFDDLLNITILDKYTLTVRAVGVLEFIDTLSVNINDVYYLKPPKPLANAYVEIYDERGNLVVSGYTDNYGRVSFFIPVGKYKVRVSKPFYYPVEFDEDLKESKVRKVYLKLYQE